MIIHEMSRDECLRMLAEERLARLACVHENQPYVVPVYLTYGVLPGGEPCLYGFTTVGQKIEWMRTNPLVCIEVDEVVAQNEWVSVIAFGTYEELPGIVEPGGQKTEEDHIVQVGRYEGPQVSTHDERLLSHQVLKAQAMWWEPACTVDAARAHRDPAEVFAPLYYRVRLGRITGHRAIPDPRTAAHATAPVKKEGWLRRALGLGHSLAPTDQQE